MTLVLSGGQLYLIICSKCGRWESFNRRLLKEYSATAIHLQFGGQIASLFDWLLLGMLNSDGQKLYVNHFIHSLYLVHFNLLNPELNPICYLLALLGAHNFLHVSRIRVKLWTFRLLMSYIYIYIYIWSTHSWCF